MAEGATTGFLNSRVVVRAIAALPAAGAYVDSAQIPCAGFSSLMLYLSYERGAALGSVAFFLSAVNATAALTYPQTVLQGGGMVAGATSNNNLQAVRQLWSSTAAGAERFVYGPIAIPNNVEAIVLSCAEVGVVGTPGAFGAIVEFGYAAEGCIPWTLGGASGAGGGVAVQKTFPSASILHRTITALMGPQPPLTSDATWALNPGGMDLARFYTDVVVRGTTGLLDDPMITFRPYVRNGVGGAVGWAQDVQVTRPRLKDLNTIKFQKTVNIGVAYTDYSANVIDNNIATQADLDGLDTLANGDWFVIGGPVPFMGAALDMDAANVNANASVLTMEYWNGAAWAALAGVTDGTILVAGKTLSGDGQITWDIPAAWAAVAINGLTAYWVRGTVSAAISANADVEECDLLMPIKAAIDLDALGDDVMLTIASQDVIVSGTVAYSGTIRLSWR